jgi:hypothetical protein
MTLRWFRLGLPTRSVGRETTVGLRFSIRSVPMLWRIARYDQSGSGKIAWLRETTTLL